MAKLETLTWWYNKFNSKYHGGKLPPCTCKFVSQRRLGQLRCGNIYGAHIIITEGRKFIGHEIWISTNFHPSFDEFGLQVLHHEMLHIKLWKRGSIGTHGPKFKRAALQLYNKKALLPLL